MSIITINIDNPSSDDAAVLAAFNTLVTTLRALPGGKRVDAGGTYIPEGVPRTADDGNPADLSLPFGVTF